MEQEQHFERVKEQWKNTSSTPASKRKDRSVPEDEDAGNGDKKRRKGGKRKKKDKHKQYYEAEEPDFEGEHEEADEDANAMDALEGEELENAQDHLAAAGLEDSGAEDDMGEPTSAVSRRRGAWSESEDDEPSGQLPTSSPADDRENSAELADSDAEIGDETRGNVGQKPSRNVYDDAEDD